MKLLTIGDSVSQGFMSLAAARTDLSYSSIVAKTIGIPENDYIFPNWPEGGLPVNLEDILRRLNVRFGSDLSGIEWLGALKIVANYLDRVEDFYERGDGKETKPYEGGQVEFFNNIAIRGYSLADALDITPEFCKRKIRESTKMFFNDGVLAPPSASFFRTALKVLNPSLDPRFNEFTVLDWLKFHHHREGVENLFLWLGANNALGTITTLTIKQSPNNPLLRPNQMPYEEREKFNLWHPEDFRADFTVLLEKVDNIMRSPDGKDPNWKVFLATIPLITIAPLAKGVGEKFTIIRDGIKNIYFKYYTYVPFTLEMAEKFPIKLNLQQALHIDECIIEYNKIIKELITQFNGRDKDFTRYHLVDTAQTLNDLAFKRNAAQVKYKFPPFFDFLYPMPDTKYYHVTPEGDLEQGGLFSLDGVHPSAIGHGIIAREFLKIYDIARNTKLAETINWEEVFQSDSLYQQPISLMSEIYQHDKLAELILNIMKGIKDK